MKRNNDVMRSDRLKQVMQDIDSTFDEKNLGISKFSRFCQEAAQRGLLVGQQARQRPAGGRSPRRVAVGDDGSAGRSRRNERGSSPAGETPVRGRRASAATRSPWSWRTRARSRRARAARDETAARVRRSRALLRGRASVAARGSSDAARAFERAACRCAAVSARTRGIGEHRRRRWSTSHA